MKVLGFSGISGTATRIGKDGKSEKIEINLPEKDASLTIRENPYDHCRSYNDMLLIVKKDGKYKDLEGEKITYKDIKIDRVDGESSLGIKVSRPSLPIEIGTLADKARLGLGNSHLKVRVDKIEGKDVMVDFMQKGSKLYIEQSSTFKLYNPNFIQCTPPPTITTESFSEITG